MFHALLATLLLFQSPTADDAGLNSQEQTQYKLQTQTGDRLELLENVIERYRKTFNDLGKRQDLDGLLAVAENYSRVLKLVDAESLRIPEKDRRKSRPLRRVEIELRKTRDDLEDFKRSASAEQYTVFERFVGETEELRVNILQLIFGEETLKTK